MNGKQQRKNLLIAFEGIDGSGKSTQVKILAANLEAAGHKVYTTFEPTNSYIGSLIRDIFSHRKDADHRTIAGLFVADRLDHILNKTNGLLKMLEEGYTVIVDRYYFSSYVYQGVHMPVDWVIQANSMAVDLLKPDVHIYIDMPPAASMERLAKGREAMELYETLENLERVKALYADLMVRFRLDEQFFVTAGDRSKDEIAADVWQFVSSLM